jgi:glycosyltransferase involved in cell wall biosynthesis
MSHKIHRVRVLVVTPFEDRRWQWLSSYFPADRFSWQFMNGGLLGKRQSSWAVHAWKAMYRVAEFDLIVSHHPYMTLWLAAALSLRRGKTTPHVAFSFNHGNKRFFSGPLLWLARRVLPTVSLFNVLSARERSLFSRLYGIPLSKIRFSHWGVRPPEIPSVAPDEYADFRPYICAMGRNNRDFRTLLKATESLLVNVIIVCSKSDSRALPKQKNVKVKCEISLDESMRILDGSLFNVVPLLDNSTGAGHMTFVHAMQLGKPQIVTDVESTNDYFFDGVHGLRVPPRDVEAMRRAIRKLLEEPETRARFAISARAFADHWLSEAAAARNAREVIEEWADGKPWAMEPEGWAAYVRASGAKI